MRIASAGCLLFALLAGCGRAGSGGPFGEPHNVAMLEPFQGAWTVDEERTFKVWRAQGEGRQIEQIKEFRKGVGQEKDKAPRATRWLADASGAMDLMNQLHPDFTVTGDTFVGKGVLAIEYRLFAIHRHGDVVCAKAWFHEDRNDPGDMTKCWVRLQRVGDEFHFRVKQEDDSADNENDPDLTDMPVEVDAKKCEVASDKFGAEPWNTYVFVRPGAPK